MQNFLNDNYKILELIYDNQFASQSTCYCPLTQEEIAEQIGCSRMTINSALKRLKKEGYVIQNMKNRRYSLTNKSTSIIKQIKNIDWGGKDDEKTINSTDYIS